MKQFFHKGLYKEGLKQTSLVAIIYFCLVEIGAFLFAFTTVSSAKRNQDSFRWMLDASDFNPLYFMAFTIFIPLIGLVGFSFLNARNKSDFFHSLPHKRESVFFSYTLSILTWLIFILAVSSLTSFCIYFMNAQYFSINFRSILILLFTITSASVLVLGAGLVAVSITGTVFSNIITTALILFLPRTLMLLFVSAVQNNTPVLTSGGLGLIGDHGYNLAFGFISGLFGGSDLIKVFTDLRYGAYSLIVGLALTVLGGFLFKIRKSESAGSPALSHGIQTTIRIALSFFFSAIATFAIFGTERLDFETIALYLFAIVVYFSYEIITAKTLKGLYKTIPGLAVVLGLNILFAVSVFGVSQAVTGVNWEAGRIDSISIGYQESYYQSPSYEDYVMEETKIKDEAVLEMVSDLLTHNQTVTRQEYRDLYSLNSFEHIIVRMKNGKTYHRRLYISREETRKFQELILDSELTETVFSGLPKDPASIQVNSLNFAFTQEQSQVIFESFKNEVETLDTVKWSAYLLNIGTLSSTFPQSPEIVSESAAVEFPVEAADQKASFFKNQANMPSIIISGFYDVKQYDSRYPISAILTPKTYEMIFDIGNQNSLEGIGEYWSHYQENGLTYSDTFDSESAEGILTLYDLNISGYNPKNGTGYDQYYHPDYPVSANDALTESLLAQFDHALKNKTTVIDLEKPIVFITISGEKTKLKDSTRYHFESDSRSFAFNVGPDDIDFGSSAMSIG